MTQSGVGAEQHGEVGESRYRNAEVGFRRRAPDLGQRLSVASDDTQVAGEIRDSEARGEDDMVHLVQRSIPGPYSGWLHGTDRRGDERNIGPIECRVEVVGYGEPFAADGIVRRQLPA